MAPLNKLVLFVLLDIAFSQTLPNSYRFEVLAPATEEVVLADSI